MVLEKVVLLDLRMEDRQVKLMGYIPRHHQAEHQLVIWNLNLIPHKLPNKLVRRVETKVMKATSFQRNGPHKLNKLEQSTHYEDINCYESLLVRKNRD